MRASRRLFATGPRSIAYGLASREPRTFAEWTTHPSPVSIGLHATAPLNASQEHALMISDVLVALETACWQRGDVRLLIEHEILLPLATHTQRAPFRWTVTGSGKEKLGVIPDRVFALESDDKGERIFCFLEADRGTMPVERAKHDASSIARKLNAYVLTWKAGIHRSRFGVVRVRVLTVTSSENRCENIRITASAVYGGHGIFLQTHITSGFSSETCFGSIWQSTANELVSLVD